MAASLNPLFFFQRRSLVGRRGGGRGAGAGGLVLKGWGSGNQEGRRACEMKRKGRTA